MEFELKPITWLGDSKRCLRSLPKAARVLASRELFRLQVGMEPRRWKPVTDLDGVREIKITARGEFRVFYVIETDTGPVVVHVFAKKTGKTSQKDLMIARQRLKNYQRT